MEDKDIDKLLKEKANNMDISDYKINNVDTIINLANQKKRKVMIKRTLVASLCACICLAILLYISVIKLKVNNNDIVIEGNENDVQNEITEADLLGTILYVPDKGRVIVPDIYKKFVLIVKVDEFEDFGIKDDIPRTEIKASVIEDIRGDFTDETVTFYIESCLMLIDDIPDDLKEEIKDIDIENNKDKYIRLVTHEEMFDSSIPEKGKYYIVSLIEEDGKLKTQNNSTFSFNEFNIETRQVKIGDVWEDLNLLFLLG